MLVAALHGPEQAEIQPSILGTATAVSSKPPYELGPFEALQISMHAKAACHSFLQIIIFGSSASPSPQGPGKVIKYKMYFFKLGEDYRKEDFLLPSPLLPLDLAGYLHAPNPREPKGVSPHRHYCRATQSPASTSWYQCTLRAGGSQPAQGTCTTHAHLQHAAQEGHKAAATGFIYPVLFSAQPWLQICKGCLGQDEGTWVMLRGGCDAVR